MAIGEACGKIILFGEHFVVHGVPAIAAGISNSCIVDLKKSEETAFIGPQGTSQELSKKSISNILDKMKISQKYSVTYGGDLPIFGGLGSSAAFCVAIVRALAKEHKLKLTDEQVNEYAYEGEKAFHGNPSGVDNTLATYGGVMLYTRGVTFAESRFEPIKLGATLRIVLGVSGVFGPTAVMVSKVNEFREKNPEQFAELMAKANEIILDARRAIERGDVYAIGKLMNENQKLLSCIGVSIDVNERLISIMKKSGALGAKITGGGGGGCCIALARDEKHAQQILAAIKNEGFEGFVTKVG